MSPRERLLLSGVSELSDADLLALILGTGGAGREVKAYCEFLLGHFNGLRQMSRAATEDWLAVDGIGPARCAALRAAFELGRRSLIQSIPRDGPLESPQAAEDFVHAMLTDRAREVFACLFLDTRHRIIRFSEMFLGTIDGAVIHPREVVRQALLPCTITPQVWRNRARPILL